MKQRGFTVIELIFVAIVLLGAAALFASQKGTIESIGRDDTRRTAINAMYYSLEDVFYKTNNFYPRTISDKNLTAMDAGLFTDPDGIKIGEAGSDYVYEPKDCEGDKCKKYSLRSTMERESDYTKESRDRN